MPKIDGVLGAFSNRRMLLIYGKVLAETHIQLKGQGELSKLQSGKTWEQFQMGNCHCSMYHDCNTYVSVDYNLSPDYTTLV